MYERNMLHIVRSTIKLNFCNHKVNLRQVYGYDS